MTSRIPLPTATFAAAVGAVVYFNTGNGLLAGIVAGAVAIWPLTPLMLVNIRETRRIRRELRQRPPI